MARQTVLDAAYAAHSERFVRGRPTSLVRPTVVGINCPTRVLLRLRRGALAASLGRCPALVAATPAP